MTATGFKRWLKDFKAEIREDIRRGIAEGMDNANAAHAAIDRRMKK